MMGEINLDRCPAVCETCGKPYRYATTLTTAIRICDCDDPPDEAVVPAGKQLEMEEMT